MDGLSDYISRETYASEILQTGKGLVELLREALYPDHVQDKEWIRLAAPGEEADYRVGIYLYDIQDYSVMATTEKILSESERQIRPKAVELSFMVFCNENSRFGGIQRENILTLLNEVMRTVYDHPVLSLEKGEEVQLSFLGGQMDFKIQLWGSFNSPLQPAVYIRAVPVLIASRRIRKTARVKERDYQLQKKEGGMS